MARPRPTARYVAFLRGINVGGRRPKGDALRAPFEALGFADVSTFLASGNVIFTASVGVEPAEIESRVESALEKALGYAVETFVRTPRALAAIAAFRPFADLDLDTPGHSLHVGFLKTPLGDAEASALLGSRTPVDDFSLNGREIYWLCRGKVTASLVSWPVVTRLLKAPTTFRNVTTLRRLAALHPPA
jgi:uncharacterized protein (DUF1697 family)